MNVAVIFAGGVGMRMNNASTPKQFLVLHGKPVIIHTLENFQNSMDIDAICISCHKDYMDYMQRICVQFGIDKAKWIVKGGATGQESIFNGLDAVYRDCDKDTIVLIHDGVRPNITAELIAENIAAVKEHGAVISCARATETPAEVDKDGWLSKVSDRKHAVIAKAPQSFYLKDIYNAHCKAREEGRDDFIDSASMMRYYGHELYMVLCAWDNIKITTPSDFYIFRAILEARENSQIFGL